MNSIQNPYDNENNESLIYNNIYSGHTAINNQFKIYGNDKITSGKCDSGYSLMFDAISKHSNK